MLSCQSSLVRAEDVSLDVVPLSDGGCSRFLPVRTISVGKGGGNRSTTKTPKRCLLRVETCLQSYKTSGIRRYCVKVRHAPCGLLTQGTPVSLLCCRRRNQTYRFGPSSTMFGIADTGRRSMDVSKFNDISYTRCFILVLKRPGT